MVESVKHAIVLLQIAKNACGADTGASEDNDNLAGVHGVNSTVDKSLDVEEATEGGASSSSAMSSARPSPASNRSPSNSLSPAAAHMRFSNQLSSQSSKASSAIKNSSIPAVSYSSSDDDEDDFFDAQEGDAASKAGSDVDVTSQGLASAVVQEPVSPLTPSDVDWDALYEDDANEEDVDMKSHGSVITHLLSQVCARTTYIAD